MQHVDICGKRGLGDIISGISNMLQRLETPSHLCFNYIPGRNYEATVNALMEEFVYTPKHTYETKTDWYTVDFKKASTKFGKENLNKTWFFTNCVDHLYTPFKTQWQGNTDGPIALAINNENCNPGYPYPKKWFSPELNNVLASLIDEEKYLFLGKPFTIKENIEKLARCRYVIGVDGAWAHACNAMRVPYYLVRNDFDIDIIRWLHSKHPTLKTIETDRIFEYLTL